MRATTKKKVRNTRVVKLDVAHFERKNITFILICYHAVRVHRFLLFMMRRTVCLGYFKFRNPFANRARETNVQRARNMTQQ